MKKFLPKTIKYRILVGLIVLQIFFLTAMAWVGYTFIQNNFLDQLNKRAAAITLQLDSALKTAFVSSDLATISAVVNEVIGLPDLNEISIYIGADLILKKKSPTSDSGKLINIKHDVIAAGEPVGRIEIDLSTSEFEKTKVEILFSFFTICFLILIFVIMLSYGISFYVSAKSNILLTGLHRYSLGDSNFRFENLSQDEFSQIYLAFNNMANALNTQSLRIEELRIQSIQNNKMSALGEMAGGISHEINNPLAIIRGRVDIIKKILSKNPLDMERVLLELAKVESTSERIAKIIRGLGAFSRNVDNDPMEHIELSKIIGDTLSFCTEKFKNHGVELNVVGNINIEIECKATQISQVLLNLLTNSFDAIDSLPNKWITIEVSSSNNTVQINVIDSGAPIDKAILDRIMLPFFTTKGVGKGTGLGLSISKGIIESHGGSLIYDDKAPNTKFCIGLPINRKP